MRLETLSILNYKNIGEATLEFSPNINCIIGNNGEGKTNLIDSIYYLSFCRSAFNNIDSQVLKHDQDFFVIQGHYTGMNDEVEDVYCGMQRGKRKHFKCNKKEYQRLSSHLGLIPVILVSPSDNSIVEGSNDERRHLMDVIISQYDVEYIDVLSRYNKAVQNRNALLKKLQDIESSSANDILQLLEVYEEEMAAYGQLVFQKRDVFINSIKPLFQKYYTQISDNKEKVGLSYVSHCQRGPLLTVIQKDRAKDMIMGYSLHGIHRDDIEMTIDGYPLRKEGSQGQNKTFVLALKLAQFEFLKEKKNGRVPILLLDDIFDKLDAARVEKIVSIVSSDDFGQIFITDTNRDHIDKILQKSPFDYMIFHVENGNIVNIK